MRQLYYILLTLLRSRGNNLVRLVSLTLGLLVGVLLFTEIAHELSFERCYPDADRLAMLRMRSFKNGIPENSYDYTVYMTCAPDLSEAMPDLVECATTCLRTWQPDLYLDGQLVDDISLMVTDTLYFRTFGVELLLGDVRDLGKPDCLFLSQSKARQLFGDADPMNRTLNVDRVEGFDLTVRGIYRDLSANTWLHHDALLSMPTMVRVFGNTTWGQNDMYYAVFRLRRAEDVAAVNERLPQVVERFIPLSSGESSWEYSVQPLPLIRRSDPDARRRLLIVGVLGFSICFVSVMNYVLAVVASLSRRSKAVGVYKCNGATSGQVMGMFLWETALLVLLSIGAALLLLHFFRTPVEEMLDVTLADIFVPQNLWMPGLVVGLLFLVAGILPGRMLTAIPVTQVFRRYTEGKKGWKRGLLFVQCAGVAFVLGLLTTAVWQYHDLVTRSVGFPVERLVTGKLRSENLQAVEEELRRQPFVESVARSSGRLLDFNSCTYIKNAQGTVIGNLFFLTVTRDFPQTAGLTLLHGHWPEHDGEAVVTRQLLETMKWEGAEAALGQSLPIEPQWIGLEAPPVVCGVVENVRNLGFSNPFFPHDTNIAYIFLSSTSVNYTFTLRLREPADENLKRLNDYVNATWKRSDARFTAYEEVRREQYDGVLHFRNTVYLTSVCILLIVLMGLIGYVGDETQRRSKEIAIRKVNGAGAADILRLLSTGILRVAVGAVLIGVAAAWYISGVWTEQFADCAMPSPLWFVLLFAVLLVLVVLTVVLRAWRIANENPVLSIKSE